MTKQTAPVFHVNPVMYVIERVFPRLAQRRVIRQFDEAIESGRLHRRVIREEGKSC